MACGARLGGDWALQSGKLDRPSFVQPLHYTVEVLLPNCLSFFVCVCSVVELTAATVDVISRVHRQMSHVWMNCVGCVICCGITIKSPSPATTALPASALPWVVKQAPLALHGAQCVRSSLCKQKCCLRSKMLRMPLRRVVAG